MTGTLRPLSILVTLLLTSAALAGCTQSDDGADGPSPGQSDGSDTVSFLLRGAGAPEGVDMAVANLTVEHIAFYDATNSEWIPLLTQDAHADVLFGEGDTQAVQLTQIPLVASEYDAVEFVVRQARVTTDDGTVEASVPRVACYAPLDLGARGEGQTIELELWISGPDAFEKTSDGWRFEPALVGTDSNAPDGGLEISEPDCMPF